MPTDTSSFALLNFRNQDGVGSSLGERSVQPFGGDGLHVDAAKTPDASGPLTSTPKSGDTSARTVQLTVALNGHSSQAIGSDTNHAGDTEAPGKLISP